MRSEKSSKGEVAVADDSENRCDDDDIDDEDAALTFRVSCCDRIGNGLRDVVVAVLAGQ